MRLGRARRISTKHSASHNSIRSQGVRDVWMYRKGRQDDPSGTSTFPGGSAPSVTRVWLDNHAGGYPSR